MAQAEYATIEEFKEIFGVTGSADDEIIKKKIANASNSFERMTGRTFAAVEAVDQVIRPPHVMFDRNGVLNVRLKTPRITEVTALAYKIGTPAASWIGVDAGLLDWGEEVELIQAYTGGSGARNAPLWARLSYKAGWAGDEEDPYPGDLVECILWWANWLYRSKDAPLEKTANPMMGTITIPSAMPSRLALAVKRWKAPWLI